MKASELRIGNYVAKKYDKSIHKIKGVYYEGSCGLSDGYGYPIKDIEPIPLTEEWLVKLGFNIFRKYFNGDIETEYYRGYRIIISKDYSCLYRNDDSLVQFEYVHQLQNLYYALTGNELTINEGK